VDPTLPSRFAREAVTFVGVFDRRGRFLSVRVDDRSANVPRGT